MNVFSSLKHRCFINIFRFVKANRGFSLLEMLAASAISGIVIAGVSTTYVQLAKTETKQESDFWIIARRMEFSGVIKSAAGWTSIQNLNPNMSCFQGASSCGNFQTPQPLKLPLDSMVLDGSSTQLGISNKGDFCQTFDAVNGNAACPIGLDLKWMALCDDSNCLHAQPKLRIQFSRKEPGSPLQDMKSYELLAFKDPKLESLNEVCTSMGGTLSGQNCTINIVNQACDPSNASGTGPTYPVAFDSAGVLVCGRPSPGSCATSDVAVGFNSNGGILCAPACF